MSISIVKMEKFHIVKILSNKTGYFAFRQSLILRFDTSSRPFQILNDRDSGKNRREKKI